MKVAEATGRGTKALYYDISTDSGTLLGSACVNFYPLGDDDEVTIEDARKNAILWACSPDLLEVLLEVNNRYASLMTEKMRNKMRSAINKARGL